MGNDAHAGGGGHILRARRRGSTRREERALDARRFDPIASSVASGATRRQALRLAGRAIAGVLLASGLNRRAAAQGKRPRFVNCQNGLFLEGERHDYLDANDREFHEPYGPAYGCPEGKVCAALLNPGERIVCRCVEL